MQITSLELFHISVPFAKPYRLSKKYGTLKHAHAVILKVHTDEGIVGLGEADPMNPFTEETPASVMVITRDMIASHLLGRDPNEISLLSSELDRTIYGHLTAQGAVNMALYDIIGKANNLPAHAFLGGLRQQKVPILYSLGSGTPEEDLAEIEEQMEDGHKTFMIKMGVLPISDEIRRIKAIRKRFDNHIKIIVDANQGWEVNEALDFVGGIQKCGIELMEQPIRRWDRGGLKRIHSRAPCPMSADESLVTVHDAAALILDGAVDVFSIKASKNGGLDRSRQIAQVADAFGIKCLMNSMLEFGITQAASLQLGCTLPNLFDLGHAYGSVLRMSDDISDFGRNISEANVTVPSGSGLGINLDESKLKKYTEEYLKIGE